MSRGWFAAFALLAGSASGQPAPDRPPAVAAATAPASSAAATDRVDATDPSAGRSLPPAPRAPTIDHDGQTFELANRTATQNAETDEYTVAGEKLAEWTQLLTVQRLTLAHPATPEEFLAYFQKRVAQDGASFEIVKQSPAATVFAVRFPRSDKNDEQVMICLAFLAADQPQLLNIVQYAIKPLRAPVGVVEMRLRSWKDTFMRQAGATPGTAQ